MYNFWYDYQHKSKLCCIATNSFIIHIKNEDFYEEIENDVEKILIHQIMKSLKDDK